MIHMSTLRAYAIETAGSHAAACTAALNARAKADLQEVRDATDPWCSDQDYEQLWYGAAVATAERHGMTLPELMEVA